MAIRQRKVNRGVVRTRPRSGLHDGEMFATSNARRKIGDPEGLWADRGRAKVSNAPDGESIVYIRLLTFESEATDDHMLVVTVDANNTYFNLTGALGGPISRKHTISSSIATKGDAVYNGDEWFIGTDAGNVLIGSGLTFVTMGMDVPSPLEYLEDFGTGPTGSGSPWLEEDGIVYWWTEYDSVRDVESGPILIFGQNSFDTAGTKPLIAAPWSTGLLNSTKTNARADKARLYRKFTSLDVTNDQLYADLTTVGNTVMQPGGLLLEADWGETGSPFIDAGGGVYNFQDPSLGKHDPEPRWPIVLVQEGGATAVTEFFRKPPNWYSGMFFQGCLVKVNADDFVVEYSLAKQPEYQPDIFFLPLRTKRRDTPMGVTVIRDRLIVLTEGAIWKIAYLAQEGPVAQLQGRAETKVTERLGVVGVDAWSTVEAEFGELVAWLSSEGLGVTDGNGWRDACRDWNPEAVGLDMELLGGSVLVNDATDGRLKLYVPHEGGSQVWDFYYRKDRLKNGSFECLGPTQLVDQVISGTDGFTGGRHRVMVATEDAVWLEGVGFTAERTQIDTRYEWPENVFADQGIEALGLVHTKAPGVTAGLQARVIEQTSEDVQAPEIEDHQTTPVDLVFESEGPQLVGIDGVTGNRLAMRVRVQGDGTEWGISRILVQQGVNISAKAIG